MKNIYFLISFCFICLMSVAQDATDSLKERIFIEATTKSVYDYLIDNGLTIKEEDYFYSLYHNENKASVLYNFFKENDITGLGYLDFYNKYLNDTLKYSFNKNGYYGKNIKSSPKLSYTWRFLFNQKGKIYYMKPDFEYDGGQYVKVWLKTYYKTYTLNKIIYKNLHYVSLVEFDLNDKKYNDISSTYYNSKGTVIKDIKYDYPDWEYLIPDTVINEIFNYVKEECNRRQLF